MKFDNDRSQCCILGCNRVISTARGNTLGMMQHYERLHNKVQERAKRGEFTVPGSKMAHDVTTLANLLGFPTREKVQVILTKLVVVGNLNVSLVEFQISKSTLFSSTTKLRCSVGVV